MSDLHKEIGFEAEICDSLASRGWLYAEGDAQRYDRVRALLPEDVIDWVQSTQAKAWETLCKTHGATAKDTLLDRLRASLDQRGTLDVLRHGFDVLGLKRPMEMAQFKPALSMNQSLLDKYAANRLRVVRQVRYSLHNQNAIDLVLFLNGVPVATAELKSDFTQSVGDAVDQYRFDRSPKPKGQSAAEPLLSFPGGALVHFAVSNTEVRMATRLEGEKTKFLPFNRGCGGGAGNPPHEGGGHPTAYLWEEIWERDGWLEILGRYIVGQKNKKKQLVRNIFPRYHQLDAIRKLVAAVLAEGPGGKYLIQHSAGSGKTNSIAWAAHFLAELHGADGVKLFNSVLVVSDRTVIDSQLQDAVFDFERVTGVVAVIKGEGGSKSGELAEALSGGKKIVVCTIQTFPKALKAVRELAATQGKRFAVIADEAHSSQSGEAAAKLKAVLSPEEVAELADGGEIAMEDLLAAQMSARAADSGVTYVAFTATPKGKTMELFGRRPDLSRPADSDNLPESFHVYSMRQAIEEEFILDVLQNYTPYKLAFKLAHNGKEMDELEVNRDEAVKGLMRWVRLHPYNIAQKVRIVVEHFLKNVAPLLNGQAKAMVVVGSRVEAVRWKLAIDKNVREGGHKIGTVVAFSGEVADPDSGTEPFTETSKLLNPTLNGRDIRDAFGTEEYQILLAANKFQTGFDQPLLCGMYVDKRLAGVQAVQTLSRLNRACPGKDTTYIVDFVNEPEDILTEFKRYYNTAELADVSDPNLVYNLREKLDSAGHYDDFEVDRVVKVEMNPTSKSGDLAAAVLPVSSRIKTRYKTARDALSVANAKGDATAAKEAKDEMDALILFKKDMGSFQRLYAFLSQIFDYGNTDLEKRFIFYKFLLPQIEFGRERDDVDLSKVVMTHHSLKDQGKRPLIPNGDSDKLQPVSGAGGGIVRDKRMDFLYEIIAHLNDLFQGDLTENDRLIMYDSIKSKLLESKTLIQQATANTKEQFANSPDLINGITNAIMDSVVAHTNIGKQALASEKIRMGLRDLLLQSGLYENLRGRASEL